MQILVCASSIPRNLLVKCDSTCMGHARRHILHAYWDIEDVWGFKALLLDLWWMRKITLHFAEMKFFLKLLPGKSVVKKIYNKKLYDQSIYSWCAERDAYSGMYSLHHMLQKKLYFPIGALHFLRFFLGEGYTLFLLMLLGESETCEKRCLAAILLHDRALL